MDMSRFLLWRLAAVSVVIVALALLLALGLAHSNIRQEEQGAATVALMLDHLGALENGPATDIPAQLTALRQIAGDGQLRHMRLNLQDSDGRELVATSTPIPAKPEASPVAPRRIAWPLQREDGKRYRVTLTVDPESERRESATGILGLLGVLLGFGALILLAAYLSLRAALHPLKDILHAIAQYQRNRLGYRVAPVRVREMDAIGQALNRMAGALAHEQALRHALDLRVRHLREDEQRHLARELHDEFGQSLTAMRADVAWLRRRAGDHAELQEVVAGLAERCEHMQRGTRQLLHRLLPDEPDGIPPLPLRERLRELVQRWQRQPEQRARFALQVDMDGEPSAELAQALYRLTQEALTNIARHADAREVDISVCQRADGSLAWSVRDDGAGIAEPGRALGQGHGLAGMRERVWALGGELEITAASLGSQRPGLLLSASLPVMAEEAGDAREITDVEESET